MENPYSSPKVFDRSIEPETALRHYGGIRRLPYLGIAIGLGILQNVIIEVFPSVESMQSMALLVTLFFLVVSFVPVYYRLQNIGMNPWWCFLMLVPIANLLIGIRCLICQEGYADTKKLDTAGKITTYIVLAIFLLVLVSVVLYFALGS